MFDSKSIDDIANRLANAIPPSFIHLKEEFEVQKAVLAKTRQKLEALEQRVVEIEQQVLSKEDL
jgi:ubiquinone biosynthesis accessory factor UbiK